MLVNIFLDTMIPLVPKITTGITESKWVDLILEKYQKLSIASKLHFTQRASMFSGWSNLQNYQCNNQRHKMRKHNKKYESKQHWDDLRFEDDFSPYILQAKRTFHLNWSEN